MQYFLLNAVEKVTLKNGLTLITCRNYLNVPLKVKGNIPEHVWQMEALLLGWGIPYIPISHCVKQSDTQLVREWGFQSVGFLLFGCMRGFSCWTQVGRLLSVYEIESCRAATASSAGGPQWEAAAGSTCHRRLACLSTLSWTYSFTALQRLGGCRKPIVAFDTGSSVSRTRGHKWQWAKDKFRTDSGQYVEQFSSPDSTWC